MQKQHPHAEVLRAIADGKSAQFMNETMQSIGWVNLNNEDYIATQHLIAGSEHLKWRIKPEEVKVDGWVNVYAGNVFCFHATKEEAADRATSKLIDCVPVEFTYTAKS